ncbi:hypothetical protein F4778DRAFT_786982 [Xylariomycetidae sp. FL2044]|nr:hypothetical protein F4778DRAFT_786982 [Xylariomycetidae sp. FL2044]
MRYHWYHFYEVDHHAGHGQTEIYKIMEVISQGWAEDGDVDEKRRIKQKSKKMSWNGEVVDKE